MSDVRAGRAAVTPSFTKSNDNDNDNDIDHATGKSGDRVVNRTQAQAPVIKAGATKPKSIRARLIAFLKPQAVRRREVSAVLTTAGAYTSAFVKAAKSNDAESAQRMATSLFATLSPLVRKTKDAPTIEDLLGLCMKREIQAMRKKDEDLGALQETLRGLLTGPEELRDVAGLFFFAIKVTSLDQQFKAIEKRGHTVFVRETPRPFDELKEKDLQELSDMQNTAKDLADLSKNYENGEKALPGTRVSRNRLLHIEYFAVQAEKELTDFFGSGSP